MIKYNPDLKEICLVTEKGESTRVTKDALEAVCAYFNDNYGSYENVDGIINYTYKA